MFKKDLLSRVEIHQDWKNFHKIAAILNTWKKLKKKCIISVPMEPSINSRRVNDFHVRYMYVYIMYACMSRYFSPATHQHFAIRIAFSSRRIRHTSAPHLIHQRAATALGGVSPRRRKCSLLHVKVRSGCQRDATNVRFASQRRQRTATCRGYWKIDNRGVR